MLAQWHAGTGSAMPALEAGLIIERGAGRPRRRVEQGVAPGLMADPAVFGVGVTESRDNPAEAALLCWWTSGGIRSRCR